MKYSDHLVLHGLGIKKHATAGEVAGAVGLQVEEAESVLRAAVGSGRVAEINDQYTLLPAAQIMLQSDYGRHYASVRADGSFVEAYDEFERVNEVLKTVITQWQVRTIAGSTVTNDHTDSEYDHRVIDRLGSVHDRVVPLLAQMASTLERLGAYSPKLEASLDRAERGEVEWVSDVKIASYHTVWFEMHEDLLRILGRERIEQ